LSSYPVAPSPIAPAVAVIVDFVASCAVAIVVVVVFARRNHLRRRCLSRLRPSHRRHRCSRRCQSPLLSPSNPVAPSPVAPAVAILVVTRCAVTIIVLESIR
jgi:hypothetical protein